MVAERAIMDRSSFKEENQIKAMDNFFFVNWIATNCFNFKFAIYYYLVADYPFQLPSSSLCLHSFYWHRKEVSPCDGGDTFR